ncbi:MAG TPA: amino acid ABC transporter permease [Clostridiales bacterium]|nr:amino acid ABC transporter permease [Clostridiales bacterium]
MNNWGLKWDTFVRSFVEKGAYEQVLGGLKNTALIALGGLLIGLLIGILIAVVRLLPMKSPAVTFLKKLSALYVGFFRGTPMVVQLLLGYYVLFPLLGIKGVDALIVAIVIFGMNSGAYVSEMMRGGILSVDYGQTEAGRAIGLTYGQTMLKIVIPQAIKNIIPTLGNEFITLVKETSIVGYIACTDLCVAFRNIGASNYEFMVPYLVMAAMYIVIIFLLTKLVGAVERRMRKSDVR